MIQLISIILILFLIRQFVEFAKDKQVFLAVIEGFMFGALYNCDEIDGEKEFTIQVCIGFVTLNIIWEN